MDKTKTIAKDFPISKSAAYMAQAGTNGLIWRGVSEESMQRRFSFFGNVNIAFEKTVSFEKTLKKGRPDWKLLEDADASIVAAKTCAIIDGLTPETFDQVFDDDFEGVIPGPAKDSLQIRMIPWHARHQKIEKIIQEYMELQKLPKWKENSK